MMRILTTIFLFLFLLSGLSGQTVFSARVLSVDDDLEEYIAGPGQTKPLGSIDIGSSDLELGAESAGNVNPQLVGIRFANITVPKGVLITKAYIRFTVDATAKNTDPCELVIKAQDADNPLTFDQGINAPISSRPTLAASVAWNVPTGSWATVGESGPDQTTPDLSALVQVLIDRSGWASGNAMVFTISGTGLRESESFDGSPDQAPQLVIEYIPVTTLSKRVAAPEDDLEEYIPGTGQTQTLGAMDAGSSDLELGAESAGNVDPQLVGIRFTELNIPKGSLIRNAYIQFTVDATAKNTDPCDLIIKAQNDSNPSAFDETQPFNISSRPTLTNSISWSVPDGSWATVGEAGADQRTPNISELVQALVNRSDWQPGSAMAFTLQGTGLRESESYDGSPDQAPMLVVQYLSVSQLAVRVAAPEDDLEEYIPGPGQTKPLGSMDIGSSDLELGAESAGNVDPQLVGIRFSGINLPQGAIVTNAYIQFTVDATAKNTDPVNLVIKAQDAGNPTSFDGAQAFNISSRATLANTVNWSVPNGSWATVGEAGADQRTPDISTLVQALVNQQEWAAGNAMVFTIAGEGLRESEAYDGSPDQAPLLVIEYLGGGTGTPTGNTTTDYPVAPKSSWSYHDDGSFPGFEWTTLHFNDTTWAFGQGPLGYNAEDLRTEIGFGPNANNKYISSYFRKRFYLADVDALADELELNVRVDDGAAIYINGFLAYLINLGPGALLPNTTAGVDVTGDAELAYFTFDVPKGLLQNGENIIAVEVHQRSNASDDLVFDLQLRERQAETNPSALGCQAPDDDHIACFTSLTPRAQNDTLAIPGGSHAFQFIAAFGDAYLDAPGTIPSNFDFTGYVPINGSSTKGYLSINHEKGNGAGGVSILNIELNTQTGLWEVKGSGPVDFTSVVATTNNCSGTVTPWNTVITCEEDANSTDTNNDGYHDFGWAVEIDPATRKVRDFGNGPQKLWRLGKIDHENVVVAPDQKTLYQGDDDGSGSVYKFIADLPTKMDQGLLYALQLDGPLVDNEPTVSTGKWILIPNTTPEECNNSKATAISLGAALFNGIEDVEISPLDGRIYFCVKGQNRVYSFKDDGTTISDFKTFVGGKSYRVTSGDRVVTEDWGTGNDNLSFDDRGNLWVLQDGGRNHIWVVRPNHTQENPQVEVFLQTPVSGEPTGMTFTPDFRYMFVSMQECFGQLPQQDVTGNTNTFNKSIALVIARDKFLDKTLVSTSTPGSLEGIAVSVFPNPFTDRITATLVLKEKSAIHLELFDATGRLIQSAVQHIPAAETVQITFNATNLQPGLYLCRTTINGASATYKLIKY